MRARTQGRRKSVERREKKNERRREREREREKEKVIIGSSTSLQVLFTIYSCKSLIASDGDRWIDDIGSREGIGKKRGEVRARFPGSLPFSTIVHRRRER